MIKKILKSSLFIFIGLLLLCLIVPMVLLGTYYFESRQSFALLGAEAPVLKEAGFTFRDLNKNGKLDPYEDKRKKVEARVSDLLSQMTLEEKAGTMFINFTPTGLDGNLVELPNFAQPASLVFSMNPLLIARKKMNHISLYTKIDDPAIYIAWHNKMQKMAERTRLAIPITFASDPRHGEKKDTAIALPSGSFSKWPEPLGLAATRDVALVRRFADIARQEYRAAGIHLSLHPTADLATEPRWSRIGGTFGEDAALSAALVAAYVRGFQGEKLSAQSVATMVKHFPGGGPQKNGEDAHFAYGKEQVYPGKNFAYHLIPFEKGAFPAKAAQVMPYYGIPVGQTQEDVGFSYNKEIITGLLRKKYGFDGVICTDWGLISTGKLLRIFDILEARAWGVEKLSPEERMLKLLDAGIDMFGGEEIPEMLVALVKSGKVKESRLDSSVRRILRDKFRLGLFDNPYTYEAQAKKIIGRKDFIQAGLEAQRKSLVLLKNGQGKALLPLSGRPKIYIENIDPKIASKFGKVVQSPKEADFAIIRINTPFQPREGFIEDRLHAGDLDFKEKKKGRLVQLMKTVPTIVDIYIDRGAVIPEIAEHSAALFADFGASDKIILDMIFGKFAPQGKLPIELPSSMEAVRKQKEDLPYDSANPLFPFGWGLSY